MVLVSATAEVSAYGAGQYDDFVIVTGNGQDRSGIHGLDSFADGIEF
jgi:hypothetical protein